MYSPLLYCIYSVIIRCTNKSRSPSQWPQVPRGFWFRSQILNIQYSCLNIQCSWKLSQSKGLLNLCSFMHWCKRDAIFFQFLSITLCYVDKLLSSVFCCFSPTKFFLFSINLSFFFIAKLFNINKFMKEGKAAFFSLYEYINANILWCQITTQRILDRFHAVWERVYERNLQLTLQRK